MDSYLSLLREGFHCKTDAQGRLGILTPYLYPDHDFIEVFVKQLDGGIVVSDLGETLRHLDSQGLDVIGTPGLKYASERIASGLRVDMRHGAIFKKGQTSEVGKLLFDVISAVKLVSCLIYGNKAYEPIAFDVEVKQFLEENGVEVHPKFKIMGVSGTAYTASMRLLAGGRESLVQTVSPRHKGGVKGRINAAFRLWSDVQGADASVKKISLLNDESLDFSQGDLSLLARVSIIHRWTERPKFVSEVLATAAG